MRHSASRCHRIAAATALATAITFGVSGCGGSPTTPPAVTNTPPTIDSLAVAGTRVEADQPIAITATVRDVETPVNQLTYTWSASPATGTFTGTGSAVTWRPAKGAKTPDLYTVTLTVTESYTSAGQAKQNSVSMSAQVHYNDSPVEASAVAYDFLVYKFGNFNVGAAEAVSNFSDSTQRQPDGKICSDEKADEFDTVKNNRVNFHILGASFNPTNVSFNGAMTNGNVDGRCQFEDIPNSGPNAGRREFVGGTCHLTTVYENFRWLLCVSNFEGDPGGPTLASLRGRVPGGMRKNSE